MQTLEKKYSGKTLFRAAIAAALLMALVPRPGTAQILYGSIVGNVTDPSSAPVPGASVTATNVDTGQVRRAETNELGLYSLPTVSSGTYELVFSKSGFATVTKRGVMAAINAVSRADATLQLGALSESIQVSAQAAALQTDRAEIRRDVSSLTLENLPIPPGRNYQQLFVMVPGFAPPFTQNTEMANPSGALGYNVNGSSKSSNNVRIDGTGANAIWLPQNATYVPPLESIETVNVVTNSFDAEQGMAGGSAVNVQIKSGTNELHGSAFEYHNDNKTEARRFFQPLNQVKSKTVYNQFGGTVGGPIRRDKLYYFGSYERTTDRRGQESFLTLPTEAIRNGDMSASPRPVYDPASGSSDGSGRTPFPGSVVSAARFDPVASKIVARLPLPTSPTLLTTNYYQSFPYRFNRDNLDSKVNWNATSKFSMYGRLSFLHYSVLRAPVAGDLLSGGIAIASGTSYSTAVAGTYVVSPRVIVDANFGWNLQDTVGWQNRVDEKIGLDVLGIPGTNGPKKAQGGWPGFYVTSYSNLGTPTSGATPQVWHDPASQFSTNATFIRGSHNIRFGLDLSRQHMNHVTHELAGAVGNAPGQFYFAGGPTTIRGGASPNQFNTYASFLLGQPTSIAKVLMVPDTVTTRAWVETLYVRDQWQVSRKLTVSYGTRWEYYPMPTRADRGLERFDLASNKMQVCGVGSIPGDCGVSMSKRLVAPRAGLAYRATDTFVIRAGYGITIDPFSLARPMRTNYPVLVALNLAGPSSYQPAGQLRNGIPRIQEPDLGNGIVDVPPYVVVSTLADRFNRGYVQSWNSTLQKRFPHGFTGQVAYVATRQVRQLGYREMNYGTPGGGDASRALAKLYGRMTSTLLFTPVGTGRYDSLQATMERRFANGFQVQANYTFSKSMGICCNDNSDGQPAIQIPEYFRLNRSVTGYHRPHNLQLAGTMDLPFGKGKRWLAQPGLPSALLGGWRVNSLFSAFSGSPFTVSSAGTSLNAPGNSQRADQVKASVEILGGIGPGQSFFDPFAFAPVTAVRFGTAGFNSLRGPGVVNLDLGLFREFRVRERLKIEFRAEAFNATNTPHFSNPGANVSNLQLNPDDTIRSLGGYTEVTSTNARSRSTDERSVRFGLRLSF